MEHKEQLEELIEKLQDIINIYQHEDGEQKIPCYEITEIIDDHLSQIK